jgi:hypothetical protein
MPKKTIDYSKTIIYKLIHNEDYDNANIYIGSTTDFVKRKNQHKTSCNNEKDKGHNNKKYQYIRENGGWGEWLMVEIEKYNCNDGNEKRAREEYWRCQFNSQLNTFRAYLTDVERKEIGKERYKKHYENNKEKRSQQMKAHYEQNRDKISEQHKEYNEQNRDKISEQITCECGCIIRNDSLARHRKSQKHLLLTKQIKYEFVDDNGEN